MSVSPLVAAILTTLVGVVAAVLAYLVGVRSRRPALPETSELQPQPPQPEKTIEEIQADIRTVDARALALRRRLKRLRADIDRLDNS